MIKIFFQRKLKKLSGNIFRKKNIKLNNLQLI